MLQDTDCACICTPPPALLMADRAGGGLGAAVLALVLELCTLPRLAHILVLVGRVGAAQSVGCGQCVARQ